MVIKHQCKTGGSRLVLAAAWNPRGELSRFERLLPVLKDVYAFIVLSFPPMVDSSIGEIFKRGKYATDARILVSFNREWSWGRYTSLQLALETPADHIQYGDMDRMLRWIETQQGEWRNTAQIIRESDCLIIGRSELAYATHPEALRQTEAISNQVVSHFLRQDMDVSAGSKGFNRQAAEYIINHCSPGHALGTDSEWPILLTRAGFEIKYLEVDGLTWESADRYQNSAVNADVQLQAAMDYDTDPKNWSYRVNVAEEIVEMAIQTSGRALD